MWGYLRRHKFERSRKDATHMNDVGIIWVQQILYYKVAFGWQLRLKSVVMSGYSTGIAWAVVLQTLLFKECMLMFISQGLHSSLVLLVSHTDHLSFQGLAAECHFLAIYVVQITSQFHILQSYNTAWHPRRLARSAASTSSWGTTEHRREGGRKTQSCPSVFPSCYSSFAPPDSRNKNSAYPRCTPPQHHHFVFSQHQWGTFFAKLLYRQNFFLCGKLHCGERSQIVRADIVQATLGLVFVVHFSSS